MPKLINSNAHAIRVPRSDTDSTGGQRVLAGAVVDADGEQADRLLATAGVRTATAEEVKRYDAQQETASTGRGSRIDAKASLARLSADARMQQIVAPLQRVVGDDAAPQGPPSGTITTRGQAATSGDDRDLAAFASGEELVMQGKTVGEGDTPDNAALVTGGLTGDDIHNAQVENAKVAERAAISILDPPKPKRKPAAKKEGE